jgi:two-component system cell cycle response regulator DivK
MGYRDRVIDVRPDSPLVLVVDDYEDSREMCAEFLSFSGFRVEQAKDGLEAVAKATALRPDVVLMDISLPGIDGWEATRRLKSDARTKSICILALTGFALKDHEEQARASGCDGFLPKPCPPDHMVDEVRKALARVQR